LFFLRFNTSGEVDINIFFIFIDVENEVFDDISLQVGPVSKKAKKHEPGRDGNAADVRTDIIKNLSAAKCFQETVGLLQLRTLFAFRKLQILSRVCLLTFVTSNIADYKLLTIDDQIYIMKALYQLELEVEKDCKHSSINKAHDCCLMNKTAPLGAWALLRSKIASENPYQTYFDLCNTFMRHQIAEMDWEDLLSIEGHKNPDKLLAKVKADIAKFDPNTSTAELVKAVTTKHYCNFTTAQFLIKSIRAAAATKDTFVHRHIQHFRVCHVELAVEVRVLFTLVLFGPTFGKYVKGLAKQLRGSIRT
jgi:hypothetical protein